MSARTRTLRIAISALAVAAFLAIGAAPAWAETSDPTATATPTPGGPDCSQVDVQTPPLILSGISVSTGPGTVTVRVAQYRLAPCFTSARLTIGQSSNVHNGYLTVDSAITSDTSDHSYNQTFSAPAGWVGVTVGAVGAHDQDHGELVTFSNQTDTVPDAEPDLASDDDDASTSPTTTPSASAASSAAPLAAASSDDPPSSTVNSAGTHPVSAVSSSLTGPIIAGILAAAVLAISVLAVIAIRRRTRPVIEPGADTRV